MLKDLFDTENRTPIQNNMLKVLSNITALKRANGDEVNEYDLELEKEALEILTGYEF